MMLSYSIAVQPYLIKYLAGHYSVGPFILTEKNRFGSYLINCLRFGKLNPDTLPHSNMRYLTGKLEIAIPEYYRRNYGEIISNKAQFRFNSFLLDEFQDRMMDFVVPKLQRKGDLNMMLLTFREKFDIDEDDLPLKTMQKAYQRERNSVMICKSA